MTDRLLSVSEVAARLRLSNSRIYSLLRRKRLRTVRIGQRIWVKQSALTRWLARQVAMDVDYLTDWIMREYSRQQ